MISCIHNQSLRVYFLSHFHSDSTLSTEHSVSREGEETQRESNREVVRTGQQMKRTLKLGQRKPAPESECGRDWTVDSQSGRGIIHAVSSSSTKGGWQREGIISVTRSEGQSKEGLGTTVSCGPHQTAHTVLLWLPLSVGPVVGYHPWRELEALCW